MRRAVPKLLSVLISLESLSLIPIVMSASMPALAETGTLADLENATPDTSTPKSIQTPLMSTADETRIDKQLYDRMMKQARAARDPKQINAYLDLARKIKTNQLGGADATEELKSRVAFYQEQISSTPADQQTDDLYYELASSDDQLGHGDEAVAVLVEMLKRFPKSDYAPEAHFRIAEDAFNRKAYPLAIQEYQAVIASGDTQYKQQAMYAYAWSLYKDGRYDDAVQPFEDVIQSLAKTSAAGLNKHDTLLLKDSYRTLSSVFVQLGGAPALAKFYQGKPLSDDEVRMYTQVGERYREQKQLLDTAKLYESFVQQHPDTVQAAYFSRGAIAVYKEAGFASDIIRSKNDFVQRYDLDQNYYKSATPEQQATLRPVLKSQLDDLANHYDAIGQTEKSTADYLHAADLYYKQLALATDPADIIRIKQRLAEALYNGGKYVDAIPYFETLAYQTPAAKPSDMGYFALLSYQAHAKELASSSVDEQNKWRDQQLASSELYAKTFPTDKNSPVVLLAMAGQYLDLKRFDVVGDIARRVLVLPSLSADDLKTASILKANADFDQSHWQDAESGYRQVLTLSGISDADRTRYQNQLAASLYKQAEDAKAAKSEDAALKLYQQAADVSKDPAVQVDGRYQAAMIYGEQPQALPLLQSFYSQYPNSPQAAGVPERIVKLQEAKQDWDGAAQTYLIIYQRDIAKPDAEKQKNAMIALWLAAESEHKVSPNNSKELALYQQYLKEPHAILSQSLEASERLYQAALLNHDSQTQQQELARQLQFYKADIATAPADVQPRLRYFAARSMTFQVAPLIEQYRAIELTQPLKDSVARKQAALEKIIDSEQPILDLKVADFVTQSQFVLGDSFQRFYEGVQKSPAPAGMDELATEQYQIAIEEQTQPLKDKAIEWHKANASLALDTWDTWVAQSFDALASLSAGRYARPFKKPVIAANNSELASAVVDIDQHPDQALTRLDALLAKTQARIASAAPTTPVTTKSHKRSLLAKLVGKEGDQPKVTPAAPVSDVNLTNLQAIQVYRGIALSKLGKFKDAATAFSAAEAINDNPAVPIKASEPAYSLGIVDELYLNDQTNALAAYQRYLVLNPDDKAVQKWVNLLQKELKLPLTVFNKPAPVVATTAVDTATAAPATPTTETAAVQSTTPVAANTVPSVAVATVQPVPTSVVGAGAAQPNVPGSTPPVVAPVNTPPMTVPVVPNSPVVTAPAAPVTPKAPIAPTASAS